MKRDPRLQGLSSEHHQALVLARSLRALVAAGRADAAAARALAERFRRELEPHFRVEDEVLLPALRSAGERALVERTAADHAFLRGLASAAGEGRVEGLGAFAERLAEHVRFEEGELFPACEARLPAGVLQEVARRVPGPRLA